MSERIKWLSALVFAVLVVATLTVGAQAAFARSVTSSCPDDGFNFLASCSSHAECQAKCDAVHGIGNSFGDCQGEPDGCCQCLL